MLIWLVFAGLGLWLLFAAGKDREIGVLLIFFAAMMTSMFVFPGLRERRFKLSRTPELKANQQEFFKQVIAVYGIRIVLGSNYTAIEMTRSETATQVQNARSAGLDTYFVNDGETHFLLIGERLAQLGTKYDAHVYRAMEQLEAITNTVETKLKDSGIHGRPAFHVQLGKVY